MRASSSRQDGMVQRPQDEAASFRVYRVCVGYCVPGVLRCGGISMDLFERQRSGMTLHYAITSKHQQTRRINVDSRFTTTKI